VVADHFVGGVRELGLADDAVGFVRDERNRGLLPPAVADRAAAIAQEIIAGRIEVPKE
jgi:basic membrane lipoprotein Med (substrate-binding protein (PBP1-ABC) superfamily)